MSHPRAGLLIIILGAGVPLGPESPLPYFRPKYLIYHTLLQTWLYKYIPYFRQSKMYTLFQTYFRDLFLLQQFPPCVFFHLPCIVRCDTFLLKSYPIPIQKHKIDTLFQTKKAKSIPYFRLKMFESDTLWGDTYLYGIVLNPPPPHPGVPLLFEEYSNFII